MSFLRAQHASSRSKLGELTGDDEELERLRQFRYKTDGLPTADDIQRWGTRINDPQMASCLLLGRKQPLVKACITKLGTASGAFDVQYEFEGRTHSIAEHARKSIFEPYWQPFVMDAVRLMKAYGFIPWRIVFNKKIGHWVPIVVTHETHAFYLVHDPADGNKRYVACNLRRASSSLGGGFDPTASRTEMDSVRERHGAISDAVSMTTPDPHVYITMYDHPTDDGELNSAFASLLPDWIMLNSNQRSETTANARMSRPAIALVTDDKSPSADLARNVTGDPSSGELVHTDTMAREYTVVDGQTRTAAERTDRARDGIAADMSGLAAVRDPHTGLQSIEAANPRVDFHARTVTVAPGKRPVAASMACAIHTTEHMRVGFERRACAVLHVPYSLFVIDAVHRQADTSQEQQRIDGLRQIREQFSRVIRDVYTRIYIDGTRITTKVDTAAVIRRILNRYYKKSRTAVATPPTDKAGGSSDHSERITRKRSRNRAFVDKMTGRGLTHATRGAHKNHTVDIENPEVTATAPAEQENDADDSPTDGSDRAKQAKLNESADDTGISPEDRRIIRSVNRAPGHFIERDIVKSSAHTSMPSLSAASKAASQERERVRIEEEEEDKKADITDVATGMKVLRESIAVPDITADPEYAEFQSRIAAMRHAEGVKSISVIWLTASSPDRIIRFHEAGLLNWSVARDQLALGSGLGSSTFVDEDPAINIANRELHIKRLENTLAERHLAKTHALELKYKERLMELEFERAARMAELHPAPAKPEAGAGSAADDEPSEPQQSHDAAMSSRPQGDADSVDTDMSHHRKTPLHAPSKPGIASDQDRAARHSSIRPTKV